MLSCARRRRRPRVCFLGTASGDAEVYAARFYRAFSAFDCRATDLPLFERSIEDLEAFLLAQDVIYVGGGNTANLLAVWRVHGLDRILRHAWERGVVIGRTRRPTASSGLKPARSPSDCCRRATWATDQSQAISVTASATRRIAC